MAQAVGKLQTKMTGLEDDLKNCRSRVDSIGKELKVVVAEINIITEWISAQFGVDLINKKSFLFQRIHDWDEVEEISATLSLLAKVSVGRGKSRRRTSSSVERPTVIPSPRQTPLSIPIVTGLTDVGSKQQTTSTSGSIFPTPPTTGTKGPPKTRAPVRVPEETPVSKKKAKKVRKKIEKEQEREHEEESQEEVQIEEIEIVDVEDISQEPISPPPASPVSPPFLESQSVVSEADDEEDDIPPVVEKRAKVHKTRKTKQSAAVAGTSRTFLGKSSTQSMSQTSVAITEPVAGPSRATTESRVERSKAHVPKRGRPKKKPEERVRTYDPRVPMQCDECGKVIKGAGALRVHKQIHDDVRPHACTICPKKFRRKHHLDFHLMVHSGDKKETCSFCGKSFLIRRDLVRHERTHTGEKPFGCSLCSKAFNVKQHLTLHMRTHTGERPYQCSICDKTFSQANSLRIHKKIHTREPASSSTRRKPPRIPVTSTVTQTQIVQSVSALPPGATSLGPAIPIEVRDEVPGPSSAMYATTSYATSKDEHAVVISHSYPQGARFVSAPIIPQPEFRMCLVQHDTPTTTTATYSVIKGPPVTRAESPRSRRDND